jgi:hypothetical protein
MVPLLFATKQYPYDVKDANGHTGDINENMHGFKDLWPPCNVLKHRP